MIELMQDESNDLESLARRRFSNLSIAEIELLHSIPKGEWADCSPEAQAGSSQCSAVGSSGPGLVVRADLLRWICTDTSARKFVDPNGIRIRGVEIHDTLDLSLISIPFGLAFRDCHLIDVFFSNMSTPRLSLNATSVRSLNARGMNITHDVLLAGGFTAEMVVDISGSRIGGTLNCTSCKLKNAPKALLADGIDVGGNVVLQQAQASGELSIKYAQIGGVLDCSNARISNQQGQLDSRVALSGDRTMVKGAIFLSGLTTIGSVRFPAAVAGVQLVCRGSKFVNHGSGAFFAEAIRTDGEMFFDMNFEADGEVNLNGAHLGTNLTLNGGTFQGPVNLKSIRVGNNLSFDGASLLGSVNLDGAQIGGDLSCRKTTLRGNFSAERAAIKGSFYWLSVAKQSSTVLDLQGASALSIHDDRESWPEPGKLKIDGFVYEHIFEGPKDFRSRLEWLALMEEFAPQPYQRLAETLTGADDDKGARRVLIEMEDRQRAKDEWFKKPWNDVLKWTIGYGYNPIQALGGLTLLAGLGWIIYRRAQLAGTMTPTDEAAYKFFKESGHPPAHYAAFSAPCYSLENSLPLVTLGQAARWQPDPANRERAEQRGGKGQLDRLITCPAFLRRFLWIQILLGWILATLFAAGVTGIVHH